MTALARAATAITIAPLLFGFGACQALYSGAPAPDMTGDWAVTWQDDMSIEVRIGGAVYTAQTGPQGGTIEIEHDGQPFTFELDCADEGIICPTEVWPAQVALAQREAAYPHRLWMTVPQQACGGELVPADPASCGQETHNPDCLDVCDGELVDEPAERFGLISEDGAELVLVLGGGAASNGVNCALLDLSAATGDIAATGSAATADWWGAELHDGQVATGYAGGCLWAGDPDGDEQVEALAVGASVVLRTSWTAARLPVL